MRHNLGMFRIVALLELLLDAQDAAATRTNKASTWNLHTIQADRSATLSEEVASNTNAGTWSEKHITGWATDKMNLFLDRYHGDVAVMHQVQMSFNATNMNKTVPEELVPKVAMLFMVKDDVEQHVLWKNFFEDAPSGAQFSIYFHQYAPNLSSAQFARENWAKLQAVFIPRVKTGWGQLAGVMYALLWEALRDPANAQFVFSSEGTVPLKSASYVYKYLIDEGSATRSKVCFRKPEAKFGVAKSEFWGDCIYRDPLQAIELPVTRALTRYEGMQEADVPSSENQLWSGRVRKHDQWVVLARQHAVDVLANGERAMQKYLAATLRAPQPSIADPCANGASDEVFVATAILAASESYEEIGAPLENSMDELKSYGVDSECTTFTYWRHCWKGTVLGCEAGWNCSMTSEAKVVLWAAKETDVSKWADARVGLAKQLNDSPRDFGVSDAQPTSEYLEALVNTGLLFGRKFGKNEKGRVPLQLSQELPRLWKAWDRRDVNLQEEHRAWPMMDTGEEQVAATAKKRIPLSKSSLRQRLGF